MLISSDLSGEVLSDTSECLHMFFSPFILQIQEYWAVFFWPTAESSAHFMESVPVHCRASIRLSAWLCQFESQGHFNEMSAAVLDMPLEKHPFSTCSFKISFLSYKIPRMTALFPNLEGAGRSGSALPPWICAWAIIVVKWTSCILHWDLAASPRLLHSDVLDCFLGPLQPGQMD